MSIEITVFRKKDGPLSKRIELIDGEIDADGSACRMTAGTAWRVELPDAHALADLIENMLSEEALALGRLRAELPDEVKVILARDLTNMTKPGVIARSGEYLHFEPGAPAYLLLDHDNKRQPRPVSAKLKELGGYWKALVSVAGGLANATRVYRSSTSAGLYHRNTTSGWGSWRPPRLYRRQGWWRH